MAHSHPESAPTGATNFALDVPDSAPQLSQSAQQSHPFKFTEAFDASQQGSSTVSGDGDLRHPDTTVSQSQPVLPSRGGTLKKKRSLSRKGSFKRSNSRRGSRPGSVGGFGLRGQEDYPGDFGDEMNSAFFTPVPTVGNPTEILASRFQCKFLHFNDQLPSLVLS